MQQQKVHFKDRRDQWKQQGPDPLKFQREKSPLKGTNDCASYFIASGNLPDIGTNYVSVGPSR